MVMVNLSRQDARELVYVLHEMRDIAGTILGDTANANRLHVLADKIERGMLRE